MVHACENKLKITTALFAFYSNKSYSEAKEYVDNIFMNKKQIALDTVTDLAADFLYYDRKDDDELSREDIKNLLKSKELTKKEIKEHFSKAIDEALEVHGVMD